MELCPFHDSMESVEMVVSFPLPVAGALFHAPFLTL